MSQRRYETLLLLSPELNSEERKAITDLTVQTLERQGGVIEKVDDWGSRDLAYPVKKFMRGYYTLFVYLGELELVNELERILRMQDGVFKFMSVKLDDEVDPAQSETPADAEPEAEAPATEEEA